jgi:hypothetical protein
MTACAIAMGRGHVVWYAAVKWVKCAARWVAVACAHTEALKGLLGWELFVHT